MRWWSRWWEKRRKRRDIRAYEKALDAATEQLHAVRRASGHVVDSCALALALSRRK